MTAKLEIEIESIQIAEPITNDRMNTLLSPRVDSISDTLTWYIPGTQSLSRPMDHCVCWRVFSAKTSRPQVCSCHFLGTLECPLKNVAKRFWKFCLVLNLSSLQNAQLFPFWHFPAGIWLELWIFWSVQLLDGNRAVFGSITSIQRRETNIESN